jgi:alpha-L-rhamnosidase
LADVAAVIGPVEEAGGGPEAVAAVLLRKEFSLPGRVRSARLSTTAHGIYECRINGQVVGDEVLAPGWNAYRQRLAVSTFDVTDLLRDGANAIGATVAEGWYRGRIGFQGNSANYGTRLGFWASLRVELASGDVFFLGTDTTWRTGSGGTVAAGIYDGETVDLRLEPSGWSEAGFDDSGWSPVIEMERDPTTLIEQPALPIRKTRRLPVIDRTQSASGGTILDFGQNLVGWLRVPVDGPEGATVTVRHAELLDADGELFTRALRDAKATDSFTLDGRGATTLEPRFTFHGFRYAEITGSAQVDVDNVEAVVVHSDLESIGEFECSDPLLNKLQSNIEWSWRGNSVGVPTDCPQRAERLGWTGDAQVFGPTACFLTDAKDFFASWLADLAADQRADGAVPHVIPNVLSQEMAGAAAWGDVAVVLPWTVYEAYGDASMLEQQYPSMKAWVDYQVARAGDDLLWQGDFQFGDWLDPTAPPDRPGRAKTDRHFVATAEFARSVSLLARTAEVVGKEKDAEWYGQLALDVKAAFGGAYLDDNGLPTSDTQTACAMVIEYGLTPDAAARQRVGDRLAELVREAGNRLATGFVGTPVLLPALTSTGHIDVAYDVLMQRDCPGWLYPVLNGATTIWERWDAIQPDGSINPGDMLSFNHYAYGAVGAWLYRTVAGLVPSEPGYRRIRFAPQPGGGLTSALARLRTPLGMAESSWRLDEKGGFSLTVEVPPGASGTVVLPSGADPIEVGPGRHEL